MAKTIPKDRRTVGDMVSGGELYVYVDGPGSLSGKLSGKLSGAGMPPVGSGAVVADGPPVHVTARMVDRLRAFGTEWDSGNGCEILTEEGKTKARAFLGDDVPSAASDLAAPEGEAEAQAFGR